MVDEKINLAWPLCPASCQQSNFLVNNICHPVSQSDSRLCFLRFLLCLSTKLYKSISCASLRRQALTRVSWKRLKIHNFKQRPIALG